MLEASAVNVPGTAISKAEHHVHYVLLAVRVIRHQRRSLGQWCLFSSPCHTSASSVVVLT